MPDLAPVSAAPMIEEVARANLPSAHTPHRLCVRAFRNRTDGVEHLALVKGRPGAGALVRIHSECLTGEALGSLRCDCGEQLQAAIARIGASEAGLLIYVRGHEGRGIGLANKIAAYALQDRGLDTQQANTALGFPADARDYAVAAEILKAMGVNDIVLLTNNPRKADALRANDIRVACEAPLAPTSNPYNARYLATKRDKMGHHLPPETEIGSVDAETTGHR